MSRRMPLPVGWTLAVLAMSLFGSLGAWQWGRADQKEAMLADTARVLSERQAQPLAIAADEIRAAVEAMDARVPARGSAVIARAWVDPSFKAALLADAGAACASIGVDLGARPVRHDASSIQPAAQPQILHLGADCAQVDDQQVVRRGV